MKALKIIFIVVLVIVAIPLIAALFMKKECSIEREVTINKPSAEVYNYVKNLQNQDKYNWFWTKDPEMKKDYRGTDGTVGFVAAWDSKDKDISKGEQEIKALTEGKLVDCELRFTGDFQGVARVALNTEAVGDNQTRVSMVLSSTSKYPMNIMNLMMEPMMGDKFEATLANLKTVLEK